MALLPCRECHKKISENAATCPECGAPFPAKQEWRGPGFEWKSQQTLFGYPLIHIAFGRNEKGRFRVAKGFIAIGQFAIGAFTLAQFGIAFIFGLGQFMFGLTAVAQIAVAVLFGCGQVAIGYVAIGQLVLAYYGLAQVGMAKYLWSFGQKDPEALEFFHQWGEKIGLSFDQYLRN